MAGCLGKNQMKANAVEQAEEWGGYLVEGRIEKYLTGMAHFVFADANEREMLRKSIEEERNVLRFKNTRLTKIESAIDSDLYEKDEYYQCKIKQLHTFESGDSKYSVEKYILAVSKDGELWKFADVTTLSDKIIRTVFPELHPDIKIELLK